MESQLPEKSQNTELTEKEQEQKRFVKKGPFVIYDTETGIYWMTKDSWQDKGKFFNWHESRDYADTKNLRKIGGFDDWRLPSRDEAATLFDKEKKNVAKGGQTIHIDPIFPEGAFKTMWLTGDTSTRRPRLDMSENKVGMAEEYAFGAIRPCRKDKVGKESQQRRRQAKPKAITR